MISASFNVSKDDVKAFDAYKVTLNDDGITSSSLIGEAKYSWSAVNRVLLTADHLLIFLAGPPGYPLAESKCQIRQFRK